jgi:hypothetical protein
MAVLVKNSLAMRCGRFRAPSGITIALRSCFRLRWIGPASVFTHFWNGTPRLGPRTLDRAGHGYATPPSVSRVGIVCPRKCILCDIDTGIFTHAPSKNDHISLSSSFSDRLLHTKGLWSHLTFVGIVV